MKFKAAIELIGKLIEVSKNISDVDRKNYLKIGYRCFDYDSFNISFVGEDRILFEKSSLKLFYTNKEIYNTCHIKKFEVSIINLISDLIIEKRQCTASDIEKLHAEFLNKPLVESEIFYNFYGAKTNNESIKFGNFEVYDYIKSQALLRQKYPYLVREEHYFDQRDSDHVIGIKVEARETEKAIDKANELVKTFENVFNYMIGDLTHRRSVGTFSYQGARSMKIVVCYKRLSGTSVNGDSLKPVNIEDPYFKDPKQGNDKLWELITKENKSKIEQRILKSVEWIGKAIIEKDPSKSLVMFVFAIEGMLQYNTVAFLSASIVSQLSEWLAFIINDDPSERKKVAKKFKDIYEKRSAIAHGAEKVIEREDLYYARDISKLMIISFLTTKPFCEMKEIADLSEYITDLKFK